MSGFRIAHVSDLHFGKIAHRGVVGALVDEINASNVDLVAVSGDLTQRARLVEFKEAAAMLAALKPPVLVVPGNHDVSPWWQPFLRIFAPFERYRRFIHPDVAPFFQTDGVAVLGMNSARRCTIKAGRIDEKTCEDITQRLAPVPSSVFKVLVVHHQLSRMRALWLHDVARHAPRALDRAGEAGVSLILCGHLHVSHVEPLEITVGAHPMQRIVVAVAGTATSTRGRRAYRSRNHYNIIDIASDAFSIEGRQYLVETGRFVSEGVTRFDR